MVEPIDWTLPGVLLAMLLGAALLRRGLRGRRVGEEPRCRRCGFDLRGTPAESTRCAECGADVRAPGGTVIGTRRRRPAAFAGGAAVLLFAAMLGFRLARGVDWRAKVPTWYALREAAGTWPGDPTAALSLLVSRGAGGGLNEAEARRLATQLLAVQKARSPWNLVWGDWLLARAMAGQMDAADRDAFFRAAFTTRAVRVRADVRAGDPVPISFSLSPSGRHWAVQEQLFLWLSAPTLALDDATVPEPAADSEGDGPLENSGFGIFIEIVGNTVRTADLSPGPHELSARIVARFTLGDDAASAVLARVPLEAHGTFTLRRDDELPPRRIDDHAMRDATRAAIRLNRITLGGGKARLSSITGAVPADVAYDVVVRQGGERVAATLVRRRSTGASSWPFSIDLDVPSLEPGICDVILRPNDRCAAETMDLRTILDGELTYLNVPVETE